MNNLMIANNVVNVTAVTTQENLTEPETPVTEITDQENTVDSNSETNIDATTTEGEGEQPVDETGAEEPIPQEGDVDTTDVGEGEIIGADPIVGDGGAMPIMGDGMDQDLSMDMTTGTVKDPLLSSWPAVIGISGAVLLVSILLGALLAKRKIKKGIDLYEN